MNLNQLRYVIEINQSGSISKAAEKLFITQPHLSKMLHELEDEFDILIFERVKAGTRLTSDGREFLDYAMRIIRDVELLQELYRKNAPVTRRLRISTVSVSHSMEALLRTLEAMPDKVGEITYSEQTPYEVIKDVANGESDVGILSVNAQSRFTVSRLLKQKNLQKQVLNESKMFVIVRCGHPLTQLGRPLTMQDVYPYGIIMTYVLRGFQLDNPDPSMLPGIVDTQETQKIIYVNTRAVLHNLLTRTDFVSFGTAAFYKQEECYGIQSLPLVEMENEECSQLWSIYPKERELDETIKVFLDFVRNSYE